ncbi:hypothetical protein SH528x_006613 [Novipirellula sp. SH528]|uniref:hypothetical protein n=1 Tax=Novipirellula sp. SH528 TaxID=3454466 RepID=UPI003F9F03C0
MSRQVIATALAICLFIVSAPSACSAGGLFQRCRLFRCNPVNRCPSRVIYHPRVWHPRVSNCGVPYPSHPVPTWQVMPSSPCDGSVGQVFSSEPSPSTVAPPYEVFPSGYPAAVGDANTTDAGGTMDTGNDDENPIGNGGHQGNGA